MVFRVLQGSARLNLYLLLGVSALATLAVLAAVAPPVHLPPPPAAAPQGLATCARNDSRVADPNAVHGMYVLDPPSQVHGAYYGDIARFLLTNPDVCGADFWVHWNTIDKGPSATPQYDFTNVDSELAPWVAAGKLVNLIFWSVGYGENTTYLPPFVLANVTSVQCGGSAVTPLFWQPSFVRPYQAFMKAATHHFGSEPGIGYLRFGLGTGGEVFPLVDVTQPGCEARLNGTGFTIPLWNQYRLSMIDFEKSLNSTVQLMVGLNNVIPGLIDNVSAAVSERAAQDGLGFGSQGLVASAVTTDHVTGAPTCVAGWCKYFNKYQGAVPLELQTIGPSAPNGSAPVGSLVPLLPYALAEHVQVLEIYFDDWLTAFDPNYPAYFAYHQGYAAAFDQAAVTLGITAG